MITKGMQRLIAVVLATLVLSACGGGSGNSVAGIDRTGAPVIAAYGTVTAFGSVVVNGVHYDTSNASFTIDGDMGSQDDIAIGDVVLVKGSLNSGGATGVATSVSFENNVVGPLTAIDTAGQTLVVLGQLVRVNADTSFDGTIQPTGLAGLAIGDVLEVSGFVQSDESINATRIGRRAAGGEFEVTGLAVGNQVALRTFFLGALFVTYRAASVSGLPNGIVANGEHVRIKGVLSNGVLAASRVALRTNQLGGASGEGRDIEGVITRFASASDFDLAGLRVTTNAQTRYDRGTAADLGLSVTVEAEGTLDDSGALSASRIEIRRQSPVRIVAPVDSINATGNSLAVLGVSVTVDSLTRLEDKGSQHLRPFSLSNLVPGDNIEVRGTESPAGSGKLLATLVERQNGQQQAQLQGYVQSVSPPLFTVLGVQINTSVGTKFAGASGVGGLAVGDLVKIEGQKLGDRAITATKVQVGN